MMAVGKPAVFDVLKPEHQSTRYMRVLALPSVLHSREAHRIVGVMAMYVNVGRIQTLD